MSRYTDKEKSIWNKAIYSVTRDILIVERKCKEAGLSKDVGLLIKLSRDRVLYKKVKKK